MRQDTLFPHDEYTVRYENVVLANGKTHVRQYAVCKTCGAEVRMLDSDQMARWHRTHWANS